MAEMAHGSIAVDTGAAPQATTYDVPAIPAVGHGHGHSVARTPLWGMSWSAE